MRIQHNIMAMNAYRNYTTNTSAMQKNLERLSSGYKINRAGDDAAGLAISEKMRAQITGLQVASKNAKDGISLVQTAEGALTEVHDMLNRMVELATQSANGTYAGDTDRTQLQKEVDQLKAEINRIADSANFNGIALLDGSMDTSAISGVKYDAVTSSKLQNNLFINDALGWDGKTEEDVKGGKNVVETEGGTSSRASFKVSLENVTAAAGSQGGTFTLNVAGKDITVNLKANESLTSSTLAQKIAEAISDKSGEHGGYFTIDAKDKDGKDVTGVKFTVKANNGVLEFTVDDNEEREFSMSSLGNADWSVKDSGGGPKGTAAEMLVEITSDIKNAAASDTITFTNTLANGSQVTLVFKAETNAETGALEWKLDQSSSDDKGILNDYFMKFADGKLQFRSKTSGSDVQNPFGEDWAATSSNTALGASGTLTLASAEGSWKNGTGESGAEVDPLTLYSDVQTHAAVEQKGKSAKLTVNITGTLPPTFSSGASIAITLGSKATIAGTYGSSGWSWTLSGDAFNSLTANDFDIELKNGVLTITAKKAGVSGLTGLAAAANGSISIKASNAGASIAGLQATAKFTEGENAKVTAITINVTATTAIATGGKITLKIGDASVAFVYKGGTTWALATGAKLPAGFDADGWKIESTGSKAYTITLKSSKGAEINPWDNITVTAASSASGSIAISMGSIAYTYLTTSDDKKPEPSDKIAGKKNVADALGGVLDDVLAGDVTESTMVDKTTVDALVSELQANKTGGIGIIDDVNVDVKIDTKKLAELIAAEASAAGGSLALGEIARLFFEAAKDAIAEANLSGTYEVWGVSSDPNGDNWLYGGPDQVGMEMYGLSMHDGGNGMYIWVYDVSDTGDGAVKASGTINIGLQDVHDNVTGASAQLANTVVDFNKVGAWTDGAQIRIGDTTYTVALGADSKFKNVTNAIDLTDLEAGATDLNKIAAQRLTVAAANNKIFSVGHDGNGNTTLQQRAAAKDSTDMSTKEKIASYLGVSIADANSIDSARAGEALTLQIGDTADSYNQLVVSISDCHTAALGLDGVNIANQADAEAAIDKIKDAINYVSDVRGTLGATQNRLDHTINNLSVMTENIQDAESTIRDTDIAEEMMAYTKNNILIQAAQAMLAQANQVPQGVLQLLQ